MDMRRTGFIELPENAHISRLIIYIQINIKGGNDYLVHEILVQTQQACTGTRWGKGPVFRRPPASSGPPLRRPGLPVRRPGPPLRRPLPVQLRSYQAGRASSGAPQHRPGPPQHRPGPPQHRPGLPVRRPRDPSFTRDRQCITR